MRFLALSFLNQLTSLDTVYSIFEFHFAFAEKSLLNPNPHCFKVITKAAAMSPTPCTGL
jgi:hypothetical protein